MNTPAFVIDLQKLTRNAAILAEIKAHTGCKILLALKAFSTYQAFAPLQAVLDGTCASSVHEARLGLEHFGGETHAFAAAFSLHEMRQLLDLGVQHYTFNSFAQYRAFRSLAEARGAMPTCGLRINPEHSEGDHPIYDPCSPHSRLGIRRSDFAGQSLAGITGLHCHNLCEQGAEPFVRTLAAIEEKFGDLLPQMTWINFGGGHHITRSDYNRELLCATLQNFHRRHPHLTCYLEPGEACALNAGTLVTTVLDLVDNAGPIAILDASCACHTPDVMEMPYRPRIFREATWSGASEPSATAEQAQEPGTEGYPYVYRLGGPSCLAGDVFGDYAFATPLQVGDRLLFEDMAHYTMVKTNTFNGIRLPDIVLRHAPGDFECVKTFDYDDFISRL